MINELTPAELAELRRLSEANAAAIPDAIWIPVTRDTVPRLLDEIERLRAELAKRPKLWVVRVPFAGRPNIDGEVRADTIEIGSVEYGDCGDAVPCIAAFDCEVDADYVAGCVGGTVGEWGGEMSEPHSKPWLKQPGEVHDSRGVPIHPGDLIRSFHFIGPRRKRHYLYHTAVYRDGAMHMVPTSHLEHTKDDGGCCLLSQSLMDGYESEVISGYGPEFGMSYEDRKRVKREVPQ